MKMETRLKAFSETHSWTKIDQPKQLGLNSTKQTQTSSFLLECFELVYFILCSPGVKLESPNTKNKTKKTRYYQLRKSHVQISGNVRMYALHIRVVYVCIFDEKISNVTANAVIHPPVTDFHDSRYSFIVIFFFFFATAVRSRMMFPFF